MSDQTSRPLAFPVRLESPSGLTAQVNSNGSVRRIDHHDIILNLFPANELEGGPANIYLRRLDGPVQTVPLLGPRSPAVVRIDAQGRLLASGVWLGLRFEAALVLAESAPAWFWHVSVENTGDRAVTVDLIHTQDLALAHYGAVRLNEYYVSQYLDHTPLRHPSRGIVLATRQNLSMGGRYPWCVIGSLRQGVSFATDALQFHGLATRAGELPIGLRDGLPGARQQHEHALAAIQNAPLRLAPGERQSGGFFGYFDPDHVQASSEADLACVDRALALPESNPPDFEPAGTAISPAAHLFATAPLLTAEELAENEISALFGEARREEERDDGELLSFFTGRHTHVVLKSKELRVLRPHGHLLRSGAALTPDEAALTSTTWMAGVFHSMVTQGHVSINRFLSTTHSYLSLFRTHGQRVFVELAGGWHLLDVPSAYEMSPSGCRWIYRHAEGLLEVRSDAATEKHELALTIRVLAGRPVRFLISHHVAINGDDGIDAVPVHFQSDDAGVSVYPVSECDVGRRFPNGSFRIEPLAGTTLERVGGDECLYADGRSRSQPFFCLITEPNESVGFRLTGRLIATNVPEAGGPDAEAYWTQMTAGLRLTPPAAGPYVQAASRLGEILPWYVHNALIHYLAPRGLEQYSGGGWGTRDVAQGPVELLLALGKYEPVRDLLLRLYRNQNADGDWPQWFMFFERERNIRPGDSHGDIVFWPVLALAQYLIYSEDAALLDEPLSFFHPEGEEQAERATLWQHIERALQVIAKRRIAGTHLAAYGHGDWNDSLQPVDPAMRENLCSAWTVTLHYQTFTALASALRRLGQNDRAAALESEAAEVLADFQRLLLVHDVLTGFAYFHGDGRIAYLVHPRDRDTGLSYSLLPIIHAISNGMLTPEQAQKHLRVIEAHLLGPDGARLFDRPLEYRGGLQRYFQRGESSSYFGREIGLMYTHAHLRYAEALAYYGDAEGFFRALCQANPVAIRELVPSAAARQANCYYSSSDAAYTDRYQAYTEYDRAIKGEIPLEGGWRVYSSGAGIAVSLILRTFLGLRQESTRLVIDPVIPKDLDGLQAELTLWEHSFEVSYRVGERGCGVTAVRLNGVDLPFARHSNPYRTGAAAVSMAEVRKHLKESENRLVVELE
ncbi:GH36-type glycosyl hydrolase domain-containing protein [Methylococcus sp. EFPC2]|uniref:GH36-type glycosyl hydrolase domain-containing protein n=1 Tax=Methylococcus sp. EFPC2 TaxID=2812648 RepID=UPI001967613A|nr:hypothetical protein [Methylococcus sp. EFPC2]QSA97841.1 hypothetical protein JWZ97_03165 [Methylococcus sp. EFPC2]